MKNGFIKTLCNTNPVLIEGSMYNNLFAQYERVIIQSLITSFGLDFIILDKYGGDVDTIHNVRKIGVDQQMEYKSLNNETDYVQRGTYNFIDYHNETTFKTIKHQAREEFYETGIPIEDRYTGKETFFGNVPNNSKTELDHIIECKSIHDDRGRVLSDLDGVSLANNSDNLAFTNKSLNASMGAWARGVNDKYRKEHGTDAPMEMLDIKAYVEAHPELDVTTKEKLMEHYTRAKRAYEAKINHAYYTSTKFWKASTTAALKCGFKMGLRQALGLVFTEVWFAVRDVITSHKGDGSSLFKKISQGVEQGIKNAQKRYKDILELFKEGTLAGILSSITTTLCNIFFTTAKRLVRIMRQSWASLVEATKIMLINPDFLPFGERMFATTKIIATGASIVTGTLVAEVIAQTTLGQIPVVGEIIQTFCGTLVTGIMSCSLLYLLDNNKIINNIVAKLNNLPTIDDTIIYLKQQAEYLYAFGANVISLDIDTFTSEVNLYTQAVDILSVFDSEIDLNQKLKMIYNQLELHTPWEEHSKRDCNELMNDTSIILTFK